MRLVLRRSPGSVTRPRLALAALSLLLFVVLLQADESARKPGPEEPPPAPLFGQRDHWAERGVVHLLGSSNPLAPAAFLPLGESLGMWEFPIQVLRGEVRTPVGAAVVVLGSTPTPLATPALLLHGEFADCWSLEDINRVRRLDPHLLRLLRDEEPLPGPKEQSPAAVYENFILHDALLKVLRSGPNEFSRVARTNVDADDLARKPRDYRGEVVLLHGRLRRIRQIEAPLALKQVGANHLYEVWALARSRGVLKQVCLLCPILPPELKPTEDPPTGVDVSLAGYFFKNFRPGQDGGIPGWPEQAVPLLIGRVSRDLSIQDRALLAAGAVVGAGFSPTSALETTLLLPSAESTGAWVIRDPGRVPSLDRTYLGSVRDRKPLPRDFTETERSLQEIFAYYDAIIKVSRTEPAAFLKSLREDITYVHLQSDPARYRGEVVRVEGRLRRVSRFDPTQMEAQAGIKDVYEAWLYNDRYKDASDPEPAVLLCTSLPEGIKVAEEVKGDVHVSFVGYFFKQYSYKSRDTTKPREFRIAPMIFGHIIPGKPRQSASTESRWTKSLVPFILLVVLGTFLMIFVMTWGFRRADRRVLNRLDTGTPPFENQPPPETGETPRGV